METEESLQIKIAADRRKLMALVQKRESKENAALLGKCFKTRNNYSCPQSPRDYWWLYVRVTKVSGSSVYIRSIQKDKNGAVRYETKDVRMASTLISGNSGYIEISRKAYDTAFKNIIASIAA